MKILIGVVPQGDRELLLMLNDGEPVIASCARGEGEEQFQNYTILNSRELQIAEQPISGSGVFRFRYGPVTSGVKEAGSYDLYTYGEKILSVGINLSWKHRRIEESMQGLEPEEGLQLAEFVCNNFGFAHSVAYSRTVEQALDIRSDKTTEIWRQLFLEAERIYNHLHVIYKLTSAASQKVMAAHYHALYEKALRLNCKLSGSRFLTGVNSLGMINNLPDKNGILDIIEGYQSVEEQFKELYQHGFDNANYLDRLHDAGTLSEQQTVALGLTGPSLRACGSNDDLDDAGYDYLDIAGLPVITHDEGDALARMEARAGELVHSCQYMIEHLKESDLWNRKITRKNHENRKTSGEGWGVAYAASGVVGYYLHIAENKIRRVRICTPSYAGMHAIATALPDHIFTDFPFVVDSFGVNFADAAC